jgi:hypothetical protein
MVVRRQMLVQRRLPHLDRIPMAGRTWELKMKRLDSLHVAGEKNGEKTIFSDRNGFSLCRPYLFG